jgi:hypothetical protein
LLGDTNQAATEPENKQQKKLQDFSNGPKRKKQELLL